MGCCASEPKDPAHAAHASEGSPLTPERAQDHRVESLLPLSQVRPRSHFSWALGATAGFALEHVTPTVVLPSLPADGGADAVMERCLNSLPELHLFERGAIPGVENAVFARCAAVTACCKFVDDVRLEVHVRDRGKDTEHAMAVVWSSSRIGTFSWGKNQGRVEGIRDRLTARVGALPRTSLPGLQAKNPLDSARVTALG